MLALFLFFTLGGGKVNPGKIFEKNMAISFKNCGCWYMKLTDTYVLNERNNQKTQISPFDSIAFYQGKLFCIEMKSTDSKSFSVQLTPDENTRMIKAHQIRNLHEQQLNYPGVRSILLLEFRETEDRDEEVYCVNIQALLDKLAETGKHSINYEEIKSIGKLVPAKKLRKNYTFDILSIFE